MLNRFFRWPCRFADGPSADLEFLRDAVEMHIGTRIKVKWFDFKNGSGELLIKDEVQHVTVFWLQDSVSFRFDTSEQDTAPFVTYKRGEDGTIRRDEHEVASVVPSAA